MILLGLLGDGQGSLYHSPSTGSVWTAALQYVGRGPTEGCREWAPADAWREADCLNGFGVEDEIALEGDPDLLRDVLAST